MKKLAPGGHIRLEFADLCQLKAAARTFSTSTPDNDTLALQIASDGAAGNLIQSLIGLAVVIGVASVVGFRPDAGFVGWLGITGILSLVIIAVVRLSVACGLRAKTVESAKQVA